MGTYNRSQLIYHRLDLFGDFRIKLKIKKEGNLNKQKKEREFDHHEKTIGVYYEESVETVMHTIIIKGIKK